MAQAELYLYCKIKTIKEMTKLIIIGVSFVFGMIVGFCVATATED
jgi:hypothetical protein